MPNEDYAMSVTVGGGLLVHGSAEAINRVQDYILLDSTHPQEREDVRRSLMRQLVEAEAEIKRLNDEVERLTANRNYWQQIVREGRAEIDRLRKINADHCDAVNTLVLENSRQADEIERLTADIASDQQRLFHYESKIVEQRAEIERLLTGVRDAIEALECGSTSAPVLEVLRALEPKS